MSDKSILLIEDNSDDRFLLKKLLSFGSLRDWKILEAVRIAEALDLIQQQTPDIILLDLSLPDSYGEESFFKVKRNAGNIPIIILTGLSDVKLSRKLIQEGAQDYLVKGEYNPRLLEKSIQYSIERHKLMLENNRSKERLIDSVLEAQDSERARIAKELHDGVVQSLTVVSMSLGMLQKTISEFDEKSLLHYNRCSENLSLTIDEIRNISHSLMPRVITEMRLQESLESLVEDMEQASNIHFHYLVNLENEPEVNLKLAIFRIVQELVNNALKHSQANSIFIQLIEYPDYISLMVEDDGQGFDKSLVQENKNCFGLSSLESRVSAHNGSIEVDSKPGKGTNVFISFEKSLSNEPKD